MTYIPSILAARETAEKPHMKCWRTNELGDCCDPDDDKSTGTPFRDIRPGAVFRTARNFIATKRGHFLCVSHKDGADVWIDPDTECWEIKIGGWLPGKGQVQCTPKANGSKSHGSTERL